MSTKPEPARRGRPRKNRVYHAVRLERLLDEDFNRTALAKTLGVHRTTVSNHLKRVIAEGPLDDAAVVESVVSMNAEINARLARKMLRRLHDGVEELSDKDRLAANVAYSRITGASEEKSGAPQYNTVFWFGDPDDPLAPDAAEVPAGDEVPPAKADGSAGR